LAYNSNEFPTPAALVNPGGGGEGCVGPCRPNPRVQVETPAPPVLGKETGLLLRLLPFRSAGIQEESLVVRRWSFARPRCCDRTVHECPTT